MTIADLPLVNASLNCLATGLLLWGFRLIRQRREVAHRRVMLAAFAVSTLFLGCYLTHKFATTAVREFTGPAPVSYLYYTILVSHSLLAMTVPVLAVLAIVLGLRDRRAAHRRVVRWAWPIWLYVSVTGVVIYLMLYQLYPPASR